MAPDCLRNCNGITCRNGAIAIISGFIFSLGWWLVIEAAAVYSENDFPKAYHTAGVFSTVGFILLNAIPNNFDDISDSSMHRIGIMVCLFVACLMSFSSVISATWILFGSYVATGKIPVWPGVAVFLQNSLICISSLLYRFGRKDVNDF